MNRGRAIGSTHAEKLETVKDNLIDLKRCYTENHIRNAKLDNWFNAAATAQSKLLVRLYVTLVSLSYLAT
jgi:hypothetical protein